VKGRNVQGAKRQRGETSCYRCDESLYLGELAVWRVVYTLIVQLPVINRIDM